jgi:hypothetical protein
MAFVVPIAAAIGGGSAATGAVILASAAATVGGGLYSAKQSREAGKAAQAELAIEAKAEGDAVRQREIERKRNLLRALSSQQAHAGAGGVRIDTGSPKALVNLDIAEAQKDNDIDSLNSKTRQRALRFRGQNARAAGSAQSTATLLDTAGRTATQFLR